MNNEEKKKLMLTLKKFLLNAQLLHQLLGQLSVVNERGCKKGNDLTLGSDEYDDDDDGEREPDDI